MSVGRPHPSVELALLDDATTGRYRRARSARCACAPPPSWPGYWRDPEATAAAFTADGFVRTGDLGWVDDAGRLRLVGRSKEMYVRGGYNVYPVEVEACCRPIPASPRSRSSRAPTPSWARSASPSSCPRDAASPPDARRAARRSPRRALAAYKLPEDVRVVDELPLTAMEKIDRRALAPRPASDAA